MAYVDQGMTGSKATSLIISIAIVAGIGLAMVIGLAVDAVKNEIERVTTVDVAEEEPPPEEEEPPPPEEVPETSPPPPVAPPPPFDIAPNPPPIENTPDIPDITEPDPRPSNDAPVADPPPPPPPPPPSLAQRATTKNERRWASRISNDYPSRALREEVEGTVGVSVTVGSNGRASGCRVTASSGSAVLDKAACRGMQRYARFNPALDDAGNPTTGSYSTRITYRLN